MVEDFVWFVMVFGFLLFEKYVDGIVIDVGGFVFDVNCVNSWV